MASLDIVTAARHCATQLGGLGLVEWSQRLLDAIQSASTGGELVMSLRWNLQELEKSCGKDLPARLRQLIQDIIKEINKTGW